MGKGVGGIGDFFFIFEKEGFFMWSFRWRVMGFRFGVERLGEDVEF